MPELAWEVTKANNNTYILSIYSVASTTIGANSHKIGRTITEIHTYPNLNALVADLRIRLA